MEKEFRLRRSADFELVMRAGARRRSRCLAIYFFTNSLGRSRIGFSVGRGLGKAVVRNRVRRLMREVARRDLSQIVPGWDIVLVARRAAVVATFSEIQNEIRFLLNWAGLWRPSSRSEGEKAGSFSN